ncbi:unnamed protein product [Rhizophagus irregularis]|nr:unnamed protein product [Rhizophagus irregularis]CAB4440497.1 unnamed protein product [Rhizophagus irregularis]
MQFHHISNERVTKINEIHEDSIIIDMELDNKRNENTENEEIINKKPSDSDENSDKVLSGESDDEYFSEESNVPMKNLTEVKKSLMIP